MPPVESFQPRGCRLWEMGDGGFVYVEAKVFEVIERYRQYDVYTPEAGGFLAGYYKGQDLHVITLTVPQSLDKCDRFRFNRLDLNHVKRLREWYGKSDKEINCLGEWHTHPEVDPVPSSIDIHGWNIFNQNRSGQRALFLIAGTRNIWVGRV